MFDLIHFVFSLEDLYEHQKLHRYLTIINFITSHKSHYHLLTVAQPTSEI